MKLRTWAMAVATLAVAGCEVGPNYQPPKTDLPTHFTDGKIATSTTRPTSMASSGVDLTRWWTSLGDPKLNALIQQAFRDNDDLAIALARLQQARVIEQSTLGIALPFVDISAGAGRSTGSDSTRGRIGAPLHSAANTAGLHEITEAAGFDAAWELDLFGKNRRQIEAARADTEAAAQMRNAVLVLVASEVARAFLDAKSLSFRLQTSLQNIGVQQQFVEMMTQRFENGISKELDVALAQRQLSSMKATIAPLSAGVMTAERRIATLLGRLPDEQIVDLKDISNLPDPPRQIAPGLPVQLVRRRPDILLAEWQFAAANARIGVAVADLFPQVSLTGAFGFQGQGLGRTPVEDKPIWSIGPGLYWPVLDFGVLDSVVRVRDLRTQELLFNYRKTVLNAVEEVDDAIANYAAQCDRLEQLDAAVAASERAVNLATQGYDLGVTDSLNVLDAQRQLYDLQDQRIVVHEAVVLQYLTVYKALGGGWETQQNIPSIRGPQPALLAAGHQVFAPDHSSEH
jgi:NodT family efflux transporter outer membrane factor (OMF) lipoprotein